MKLELFVFYSRNNEIRSYLFSILSTSFNTCWFRHVLIWTQPRGWQTQSTDQNVSPLLWYWWDRGTQLPTAWYTAPKMLAGSLRCHWRWLSFVILFKPALDAQRHWARLCLRHPACLDCSEKIVCRNDIESYRACHDHNESSQCKHTCKVTINHHSTKIPPIHMT